MTKRRDSKHDEARRAFLVGAAVGAATGAGLVPGAVAQEKQPAAPASARAQSSGDEHGAFFNDDDAATVAAFAERIMPGAPDKPGALDANVINYIDLALAGAYADQQDFYRHGLTQLDDYCGKTFGHPFVKLDAARQDEVIAALEQDKATGFTWPSPQAFFNTLRRHTMEGMFADPIYGGNKDFAGWRLVGFPGAQPVYTPADLKSTEAFTRAPMIGLKGRA